MLTNMNREIYAPKQSIQMNATQIEEVFAKYQEVGFLYPAKMQLLRPHFSHITENWKRLFVSREQLLWIFSATEQAKKEHFASISVWKSGNYGCFAQHLVSTGNPFLSLKVMMEAQAFAAAQDTETEIRSSQNWFRPNNRYAYRVFASMYDKLGDRKAALLHHQYLHLPLNMIPDRQKGNSLVEEVQGIDRELIQFVRQQYGEVFVHAEELDQEDIQFRRNGRLYRQYRLHLFRRIFKVRDPKTGSIQACLIANRAPLGLNFSFLENRAYYILDKKLKPRQRSAVLSSLNYAAYGAYYDIPLGVVPIVTESATAGALFDQGAIRVREYVQSIWLREGFRQWYEHIGSFLKRIERKKRN